MAAITSSTASLCYPAAGLPSSSSSFRRKSSSNHGRRLQATTACHCRPSRYGTTGGDLARMERVARREALFGILLSAVAAPALAPADAPAAEGTGTAASTLLRSRPPPAVGKCVLVHSVRSGETMPVSSVLSSADQSCRRASPRTRMRPTSSALRFHKVILLLLLLQILYKERTCMLKIRRSLKNKKKKAAPAGRIRWQNSWIDPAIVVVVQDG